ncbi:MAG: hypothetical protein HY556_03810 [Euryarchaeota archaeon]|nr:hypothetical protein [Euryarchaeota archaeon]
MVVLMQRVLIILFGATATGKGTNNIMNIGIGMSTGDAFVRTTISLREDLYQMLRREEGGISEAINRILAREFKRDHSMFGAIGKMDKKDLRDHRDRV